MLLHCKSYVITPKKLCFYKTIEYQAVAIGQKEKIKKNKEKQ